MTYCLFDSLLNLFRDVSPHIGGSSFGSCIGIVAIISDVVVVLTFAIHGGFYLHGVFDG